MGGPWIARMAAALALVPAAVGCAGTSAVPGAPSPADRAAVVATVERLFDAINTADGALARSLLTPDAHVEMLGAEGRVLGRDGLVTMVEGAPEPWVERMWDPEVRVHGDLASLWAPYDFYRGGRFSHCGVDAVHLERTADGWAIVSLVWVREQPPACSLHPGGPPAGAGG